MRRITAPLLAFALIVAACGGGDDAATTTSTTAGETTTTVATTTTTSTTTTVAETTTTTTEPPTGPLAGFLSGPVEDPFFDSGFHEMEATDDTNTRMVSVDSILGTDPQRDRLVLEVLDPEPALTGVGEGELLVAASVDDPSGDTAPAATVLYALGPDGWSIYTSISGAAVLAFLETTTDYQARGPNGPAVAVPTITAFDWSGRAQFKANVAVFTEGDPDTPAFEAEVECTVTTEYECALLSDDGVLRPGDEGEAVQALQGLLGTIDYYDGEDDGVYDDDVTAAVSSFQRDYRLSVDGKAGPNTLEVLESVASGESEIVMARSDRVGTVRFATPAPTARAGLVDIFGTPTADTGWYADACDGQQWNKVSWPGFTAIFTDRSGTETFDGWHVDDLAAIPSWLFFEGGIRPTTTWSYLQALGAGFDAGFGGFWFLESPPYNNGRFTQAPGDEPPADATVASFGTGTGAFVSC